MKKLIILLSISMLSIGANCQVQSFLEFGLMLKAGTSNFNQTNAYNVKGSIGYASKIYTGVGVGLDVYPNQQLMPLTVDLRTNFKTTVAPLIGIAVGYSLPLSDGINGGMVINPSIGLSAKIADTRIYFTIGYKSQSQTYTIHTFDFQGKSVYTNETLGFSYFTMTTGFQF